MSLTIQAIPEHKQVQVMYSNDRTPRCERAVVRNTPAGPVYNVEGFSANHSAFVDWFNHLSCSSQYKDDLESAMLRIGVSL